MAAEVDKMSSERNNQRLSVRLGLRSRQSKLGPVFLACMTYMVLMSALVKITRPLEPSGGKYTIVY